MESRPRRFPSGSRNKIVFVMKWDAVPNNYPAGVVNTRPLRAGGETPPFAAGVACVAIQLGGRWSSLVFREYIHRC